MDQILVRPYVETGAPRGLAPAAVEPPPAIHDTVILLHRAVRSEAQRADPVAYKK